MCDQSGGGRKEVNGGVMWFTLPRQAYIYSDPDRNGDAFLDVLCSLIELLTESTDVYSSLQGWSIHDRTCFTSIIII